MTGRVLIVEDDPVVAEVLYEALRDAFVVDRAANGADALALLGATPPDVVILDLLLPGMRGMDVCRSIRRASDVPIVVVTGVGDSRTRAQSFLAGADEFLTKPVRLDELRARLRALIRRRQPAEGSYYSDGNLIVDLTQREVYRQGQPVSLSATELRLLEQLVRNAGKVLPHRELLLAVWGRGYEESVRCLHTYIHYLRRKLEDDPSRPQYIRSYRGQGYSFQPRG